MQFGIVIVTYGKNYLAKYWLGDNVFWKLCTRSSQSCS